jgi:amyloid beta precursor protein binding protein 1
MAAPSLKQSELYDRQIRLWGPHGQAAIQSATLYVLGSDCEATEFLKTMVLHGVQHVTIVDDAVVTDDDLLTNFFTELDSKGAPRADVAAALLAELNPYCTITSFNSSPDSLHGIADLPSGSFVITTGNRPPDFLGKISAIVAAHDLRQAHLQTSGFFGAFYLDGGLHHLVEGVPAGARHPFGELRILNPFPELQEFWNSFDLDALDDTEHSHLPFPLLLNRANRELRAELDVDRLTTRHRTQLVAKLLSYRRPNGAGDFRPNEAVE